MLVGIVAIVLLLLLLTQCDNGDETADSTGEGSSSPVSGATNPSSEASLAAPSTSPLPSAPDSSTAPAPVASAPATPTAPVVPSGTGSLTAGSTSLSPLSVAAPDGSLRAYKTQAVTARAVQVLSVPADEGFWTGTSDADRVWVQIIGAGESPYKVTAGDVVDFTGSMVKHSRSFPEQVGVGEDEGAQLLRQQRAHIEADQSTLMLTAV